MGFMKSLGRGVDAGAQNYVRQRLLAQQREDALTQREEEKRRYEQGLVNQRLGLAVQMAMQSGDPDAIATATQAGVEGGLLPSTKGITPPPQPMEVGEFDPRMVIPDTETVIEAPDPYGDLDPTAQGLARGAARKRIIEDQKWAMEQEKHRIDMMKANGWSVVKAGVLFNQGPNGEPIFDYRGNIKKPHTIDKDRGIIYFDDNTQELVSPDVMDRITEYDDKERQDKLELETSKIAMRNLGYSEKAMARISLQKQKEWSAEYNRAVKSLKTTSIADAIRNLENNLSQYPDAGEFLERSKVALAQNGGRFKIEMNGGMLKEMGETRAQMSKADDLIGMLGDKEVQDLIGPLRGRWNQTTASLLGNKNLTPRQIEFITKLSDLRDNTQRDRSGAALTNSELVFYERLIGSEINTPESLRATLSAMIEGANKDIRGYYIQGLINKNEAMTDELLRDLDTTILYQPRNVGVATLSMGLDDEALDEDEDSTDVPPTETFKLSGPMPANSLLYQAPPDTSTQLVRGRLLNSK